MSIYTHTPSTAVLKCLQRQASPKANIYGINVAGLFRGTLMKPLTLLTPRCPACSAAQSIIQACGWREGCRGGGWSRDGGVRADVRRPCLF